MPANGVLKDTSGNILAINSVITAATDQAIVFFTPNANYNGVTSFLYAAINNNGAEDAIPATATITVNALNNNATMAAADEQLTSNEPPLLPNSMSTDTDLQSIQNTNGIWTVY